MNLNRKVINCRVATLFIYLDNWINNFKRILTLYLMDIITWYFDILVWYEINMERSFRGWLALHCSIPALNLCFSCLGGLIIRKKPTSSDESFKMPAGGGGSRLGLDKLAAIKERERRENEAAAAKKRQLEEDVKEDDNFKR